MPPIPQSSIPQFNVFSALVRYPELMLETSKYLSLDELITLYATSRDFHQVANQCLTSLIQGQCSLRAPTASTIFIPRCYKSLCRKDPTLREIGYSVSEKDKPKDPEYRTETGARLDDVRLIPTFRWLQMVTFRESVVEDILCSLKMEGHNLPPEAKAVLQKIWFIMDISDNKRRVGLAHNQKFLTNEDIFMATTFFLKLDMRLTHPIHGTGQTKMRTMLLGQRSLTVLSKVLKREEMRNQYELMQMVLEYNYRPNRPLSQGTYFFGVPAGSIGTLSREGWGKGREKLLGPDALIMRESIRRRLDLPNYYIEMMLSGYINKETGEDIMAPPIIEDLRPSNTWVDDTEGSDGSSDVGEAAPGSEACKT